MKKIFLFLSVIFISLHTQAQNSDVWQKVQELRNQYFSETAHIPLGTIESYTASGSPDLRHTNVISTWTAYRLLTPLIVINDVNVIANIDASGVQATLDTLNKYRMADIAGINYYLPNEMQPYGKNGKNGVIIIYTKSYTYTYPPMIHNFKINYLSPNDPTLGRYYQERRKQEKKEKKGKK
ncbi:MAG: hypothetical protein MUC49_20800 [Raineya sp.]|jgi:hypothetical protein|nr:hypothetical protein [Raineya sp.]